MACDWSDASRSLVEGTGAVCGRLRGDLVSECLDSGVEEILLAWEDADRRLLRVAYAGVPMSGEAVTVGRVTVWVAPTGKIPEGVTPDGEEFEGMTPGNSEKYLVIWANIVFGTDIVILLPHFGSQKKTWGKVKQQEMNFYYVNYTKFLLSMQFIFRMMNENNLILVILFFL